MVESYRHFKSDVMITVADVFVFPPDQTRLTNFAPWFPVDMDPIPIAMVRALEPAIYRMCYSQWGCGILERAKMKAHYVPCSAPADLFTPGDKREARAKFSIDVGDKFLVAIVAANKDAADRKGFSEALQGFAKFLEHHEDAMLYLHTDWGGPVKVADMAKSLGIERHIIQPDQYALVMGMLNETYMRDVYRAADVLLNPSKSEGFGLPLVEAQMCGCPIIASDFATTDELLFAGWKLPGQLDWYMGADAWRWRVNVDGVTDALAEAYEAKGNERLQKQARKGAIRFDTPAVFKKYWRPALKAISEITEKNRAIYDLAKNSDLVTV
jgi:glycosyltransferase involved in cell wall biosynthesis